MHRIGILAGGGRLPLTVAESVTAQGGSVHIVAIEGEAHPDIARFPHTWVKWGQIGRMVSTLRAQRCDLVIAGGVRRPDLWKLRPDAGFFRSLPQIVGLMAGGDDSVLARVVRFFEQQGLTVRGAHEVAPGLLADAGPLGAQPLPQEAHADALLGFAVRTALGPLDAGQAVVVADGVVLAIEGAEGTDAMLQRVTGMRRDRAGRSGVLTKGPKPGQELRVDMPAIGPRTVERVVAARLAGVVVEAGAVLVLDRDEAVQRANGLGCALYGLASPAPVGPHGLADQHPHWRVVGGRRPKRRDALDLDRGFAAVARLAPFKTGGAAVVARAYILAIAAAEGVSAMLERVGALRQWGLGSKRRVGVLVCRAEAAGSSPGAYEALLEKAAAQGLAGVAVAGSSAVPEACQRAAPVADRLGIFLAAGEMPREEA